MRVIELAGPVGAGKSTVAAALPALLAARGYATESLEQASGGGPGGRIGRLVDRLAFATSHPALLVQVVRSLLASPIGWSHRRRILGLVIRLGARLRTARRRADPDGWVIVDEGWVHRVVNVFGWRSPPPPRREVETFLDRTPRSALVIVVDAPAEASAERAMARGLPQRLRGADPARVSRFLESARAVLDLATASLEGRAAPVIRISNDGTPEELRMELDAALDSVLTERARLATARVASVGLPRPDRLVQRAIRRRAMDVLDTGRLGAVMEAFAFDPGAGLRVVASPGGRGSSVLVEASDGRWVLKRYKRGLEADAIRGEHSILLALERRGLPAPRLRPTPSGMTLVERDGDAYAAFEHLAGYVHPHERLMSGSERAAVEAAAGQALGALHTGLDGFVPAGSSANGLDPATWRHVRGATWMSAELRRAVELTRDGPHADELSRASDELGHRAEALEASLQAAGLTTSVIHGDYGPYNLLIRAGHPIVVLDFELARLDWRLVDLATGLPRFAGRRTGWDDGAARRFVAGYRSAAPMSDEELSNLPSVLEFLSLRRAVVSWGRVADGASDFLREARARISLAGRLSSGDHPMARLAA